MKQKTYHSNTSPMLSHINIGTGKDTTIRELAETMKEVVGFKGGLVFDESKPDGTPRKLIDVTRLSNMGWNYKVDLKKGLELTYSWYIKEGNE
jgi:nucleoside-diphosphate-sugar epimerase